MLTLKTFSKVNDTLQEEVLYNVTLLLGVQDSHSPGYHPKDMNTSQRHCSRFCPHDSIQP